MVAQMIARLLAATAADAIAAIDTTACIVIFILSDKAHFASRSRLQSSLDRKILVARQVQCIHLTGIGKKDAQDWESNWSGMRLV